MTVTVILNNNLTQIVQSVYLLDGYLKNVINCSFLISTCIKPNLISLGATKNC